MSKLTLFSLAIVLILLSSCDKKNNGHGADQAGEKTEAQPLNFKKHVLTKDFISEGVASADVNKDGKMDVIAGAYWFQVLCC